MSRQMKYPGKIHLQTPLHFIVHTQHEETVALRRVTLSKRCALQGSPESNVRT